MGFAAVVVWIDNHQAASIIIRSPVMVALNLNIAQIKKKFLYWKLLENISINNRGKNLFWFLRLRAFGKMQVLNLIKEQFARLGIHRLDSLDKFDRFNFRNCFLIIIYCIWTALLFIPIFNLKTNSEFSIWFYATLSSFVITCVYCVFVWHTPTIYRLIDNFEELIQKREYLIHTSTNIFS